MAEMSEHIPAPTAPTSIVRIERSLRSLRRAIRTQLAFSRGGTAIAWALGVVIVLVLLDYLLRLPVSVRMVLWIGGLAGLAWSLARALAPAARFASSLSSLALRVEASDVGQTLNLRGQLASAIDLARAAPTSLSTAAVDELARSMERVRLTPGMLLNRAPARRALLALSSVGAMLVAGSVLMPTHARAGLSRTLTPWRDAQWPKVTGVELASLPEAHARGTPLTLRAILTRSNREARDTRVVATMRVLVDDRETSVQRAVLSPQMAHDASGGTAFERVIDTASLVPAGTPRDASVRLEVSVATRDDETGVLSVDLIEPPRIARIAASVSPPPYLLDHEDLGTFIRGERVVMDVRDGASEQTAVRQPSLSPAPLGPVLAGSTIRLIIGFDSPVPSPSPEVLARVAPMLAQAASTQGWSISGDERSWTIDATVRESVRVGLTPVNVHGIAAKDEVPLRVDVVPDLPPTAIVTTPASDESVLASAAIGIEARGRDDVGLASVRALVRKAPASGGDEAQATPDGEVLAATEATPRTLTNELTTSATLDLGEIGAKAGEEYWVWSEALDLRGSVREGREESVVVSAMRRLTIISESELVSQISGEMGSLREAASRLEEEQARLSELRERALQERANGANDQASRLLQQQSRAQAGVAQRAGAISRRIGELAERIKRNRLDDEALRGLLEDAEETASSANDAGHRASESLAQSAQASPSSQQAHDNRAREQQERAEDELGALADALDTRQDEWSVQREIERIVSEQRQVRAQSQTASAQNQGQDAASLSPQQREELEALARKQEDLARRTRASLQRLDQRADQLREQSPAQAQTLEQAAQQAREGQAADKQEQAAQQLRENRAGQAQQSQREAEQALEDALRKLDDVQRARDEQLRRTLADLIEQIDELIAQQERALALLAPVLAGEGAGSDTPVTMLADGMIALQRNTLGSLSRLRGDEERARQLESVLGLLGAASDAQGAAIVVLRRDGPDLVEVDGLERTSLDRLRQARDEADEQMDDAEQREQARERQRLRERYQELLERHLSAEQAAQEHVGKEPTRRSRAAVRQASQQERAVREALGEVRSSTQELSEAKVFDFAHARLDATLERITTSMDEGLAPSSVGRDMRSVSAMLQSIIESLRSERDSTDDLQDSRGGGGGGGGGGQQQQQRLIPPLAELVLLRGMQAETNRRTREQGEAGAGGEEIAQTAQMQEQLANLADALLESLKQEQEGPPQGAGEGGGS